MDTGRKRGKGGGTDEVEGGEERREGERVSRNDLQEATRWPVTSRGDG